MFAVYMKCQFLVVLNTECITKYLQAELLLIKNNSKQNLFLVE